MLTTTGQVSDLKSTTAVSRCGIFTIAPPPTGDGVLGIAHLVVMMVDSTSETWCGLDIDASGRHEVIYRSEIHAVLAEISHMCHLGPGRPWGIWPRT